MKAGPVEIGTLLQNRNRYCVPIYQRHYVWNKNKQWEPFWQDIRTKAVERLAGRERRFSHFMGAVVLESRAKPSVRQVPSFQVVDGQQRLTTFQIFLTAARHYAGTIGYETAAANIRRYVMNSDPQLMELPEIEIYKVWPTEADRALFLDIISSADRDYLREKYSEHWYKKQSRDQVQEYKHVPKLLGAYGYFYDRIRHSVETDDLHSDLDEAPELEIEAADTAKDAVPPELKLDAIWQSLLEEFKVVEIVLEEGDDAQVIFETLNDRGEALLAADLVRNNIFQRADAHQENAEGLFAKHWKQFEAPFWYELEKQGRYKKQRVEFFLANFIAGQIASDVTISKLFSEYKAFLRPPKGSTFPRYATVAAEIKDLEKHGLIYREFLEKTSGSALATFAQDLRAWDVTTANPLVLRLWAEDSLNATDKAEALKFLLTFIVRRAVCFLDTKNYNNLFLSAIASLDKTSWSLPTLKSFFASQTSESGRLPKNDEFVRKFIANPVYRRLGSAKTRAILVALEMAKRGKFQETDSIKNNLTVEHILPDKWSEHWKLSTGLSFTTDDHDRAQFSELEDDSIVGQLVRRERMKHSLGNLTLVTQSFNSSVSNHAFHDKKKEFEEQSLLMLTKDFVSKAEWSEKEIQIRGTALAELACQVWPFPND
jgi:uncharacterized protein with ParB-like and HNH nuclease domain